jgi:hypothetical protein
MGRDRELALVDAKRLLDFPEPDVGLPHRLTRPVGDVRTQDVAPLAAASVLVPAVIDRPLESDPSRRRGVLDDADAVALGGATVAFEQAAELTLDGAAIHRLLGAREPPPQTLESRLDASRETLVHGVLLLAPFGRATQQEGLGALRPRAELDLDVFADPLPVALEASLATIS